MSIDALSQHLLRLELFQGLKPLQITEIVRNAERVVYKPGTVLIEDGTAGDAAIIIVAGEAVRTRAPMADLAHEEEIQPGSMLGEMAMLIETEHSSTVVARTAVRALRISRVAMHGMIAEDAALAEHLVAKVARRLNGIAAELRKIDVVLAEGAQDHEGEAPPLQPAHGGPLLAGVALPG